MDVDVDDDDDSPVLDDWVLMSQGAEARVYSLRLCGMEAIAKHRFGKSYRLSVVDLKLRKERTLAEARCLAKCSEVGIAAPALVVSDTARYTLYMERVPGPTGKAFIDETRDSDPAAVRRVLTDFGRAVASVHDAGMTHGDLTTSNVICRRDGPDARLEGVVLIDFGLGGMKATSEDKAVDLYVLERALVSTHRDADDLLKVVLDAYAHHSTHATATLKRLNAVRARGRKRDAECFG